MEEKNEKMEEKKNEKYSGDLTECMDIIMEISQRLNDVTSTDLRMTLENLNGGNEMMDKAFMQGIGIGTGVVLALQDSKRKKEEWMRQREKENDICGVRYRNENAINSATYDATKDVTNDATNDVTEELLSEMSDSKLLSKECGTFEMDGITGNLSEFTSKAIGSPVASVFYTNVLYKGECVGLREDEEGILYRIRYRDGDGEEMDEMEFKRARALYDLNYGNEVDRNAALLEK